MIQTQLAYNSFGFETAIDGFELSKKKFIKKIITDFIIDYKGIIREKSPSCPCCQSIIVVCNGYTGYDNKLFSSLQLNIYKGQYVCHGCGQGYIVELPHFNEMSKDFKDVLRSLITSLRLRDLHFKDIAEVLKEAFGFKISEEHIRKVFEEVSSSIRDLTTYTKQSGYYAYDAQHLKINGRPYYRHVVHDLITGKVLIDTVLPKQNKETIKAIFKSTIDADVIKAFVIDMANAYPNIIKDCFGSKVKIQWCLFHLHQDIKRKYKGCKKEIDDSGFQNELNKQILFDVHYPRPELTQYLNRVLQWLRVRREKLKHLDAKILKKVLKKTRKYFWKEYRGLQKLREKDARKNGYKIRTGKKEIQKKFNAVYEQKQVYPKSIQKVIKKMKEHSDRLILFIDDKNVPPTNNVSERYFSKTCRKTQKKSFRSVDAALLKCKIHFLQENGTKIYEPQSIFNFVAKYRLFFERCNTAIT